jgi:hypothetical protein
MALELDIFQDTTANTMFADSTMAAEETAVDNARYNDEGDRLYYWVPPSELGDPSRTSEESELYKDIGGYYTEAEIRAAWDAKQGMGYLKEQTDWDNYWGYLTERQDLIDNGTLNDGLSIRQAGRDARDAAIRDAGGLRAVGGAKAASAMFGDVNAAAQQKAWEEFLSNPTQTALMEKYGIPTGFQNDDGDVFQWNGSSYTKTYKVDDSFDVGSLVGSIALAAITAGAAGFLAPTLAGALGVSNTVAKGLITAAIDLSQGKGIGLGTALSLVGGDVLPGGATLGEMVDNGNITQDVLDAIVGEITNPDNYRDDDNTVVWGGHGGTDEIGNPVVTIPDYTKDSDEDDGGGGASEDPSASNDDTGASADSAGSEGSGIVNETGEEVTTGGEEVDGTGTQIGAEYRWKYIGNGCFVQIDENGVEIPGTKVCDPDYTEEDYSLYEVGGIFGRGTDAPFGSSDNGGEDTTSSYEPSPAGTDLGYECLPNGDKVVYTSDGNGGSTTEVIKGGCLENEGTGGVIVTGGNDDDDSSGGTTNSTGDTKTGEADEDADGDGTEGTGESGAGDDGVGDDGTGEGEGGDGNGDGEGNGITSPAVSGKGSYEGTVQGLSYVAQPVPGMLTGTPVDAMSQLNGLMAELMNKRENLV